MAKFAARPITAQHAYNNTARPLIHSLAFGQAKISMLHITTAIAMAT